MITVRLPTMLRRAGVPAELKIRESVETIADVIRVLEKRVPGLAAALDDSLYTFAVNDSLIVQRARQHAVNDGDVVELVPAIAGG